MPKYTFPKRQGQNWTYKAPNSRTSHIYYVIILQNWENCEKNCSLQFVDHLIRL